MAVIRFFALNSKHDVICVDVLVHEYPRARNFSFAAEFQFDGKCVHTQSHMHTYKHIYIRVVEVILLLPFAVVVVLSGNPFIKEYNFRNEN